MRTRRRLMVTAMLCSMYGCISPTYALGAGNVTPVGVGGSSHVADAPYTPIIIVAGVVLVGGAVLAYFVSNRKK